MVETQSPIDILATEYKEDLDKLKAMNPVAITKYDINRLKQIVGKYGIHAQITKKNYYEIKTLGMNRIMEKLEKFAIEDILEKVRTETEFKLPKEPVIKKQKMPSIIKQKIGEE